MKEGDISSYEISIWDHRICLHSWKQGRQERRKEIVNGFMKRC